MKNSFGPDISQRSILAGDRDVQIIASLDSPRVVILSGLLTDAECDQLIELAEPKLTRSTVVAPDSGSASEHEGRTSLGAGFERSETELIAEIEARVAEVVRWPEECFEGLQVLRYEDGEKYDPHLDFFDPELKNFNQILKNGGQRIGTMVIYLSDPDDGGETVFPLIAGGLKIKPRKGMAVFFSYIGQEKGLTLHAGSPVQAGEKYIATVWIRQLLRV